MHEQGQAVSPPSEWLRSNAYKKTQTTQMHSPCDCAHRHGPKQPALSKLETATCFPATCSYEFERQGTHKEIVGCCRIARPLKLGEAVNATLVSRLARADQMSTQQARTLPPCPRRFGVSITNRVLSFSYSMGALCKLKSLGCACGCTDVPPFTASVPRFVGKVTGEPVRRCVRLRCVVLVWGYTAVSLVVDFAS